MNKKALITAAVFIGVGVAGLIPCLLSSVPYFTNLIVTAEHNVNKTVALNEVATIDEEVTTVVINSQDVDVRVVPSTSDKVEIYKSESRYAEIDVTHSVDQSKKQLTVTQTGITFTNFVQNIKTNQIDEFIQDVVTQAVSNRNGEYVEIRVPNEVNIVATSNYEDVTIDKAVVNKNVNFSTSYGDISFVTNNELKELGKLTIVSKDEVDVKLDDLTGFKEVTVDANEVNVEGVGTYGTLTVNDGYPVNALFITAADIDIYTTMPIAKTVNLNGKYEYGTIEVSIPIDQFDITWEIMSDDYPIEFDSMNEKHQFAENKYIFNGKLGNGTNLPSTIIINAPNQEVEIDDYL